MSGTVHDVPLADLRPNPHNPRRHVGDLDDLIESIREHGILQPVLAAKTPRGLVLISGHRRVEASRLAGRATVPVVLIAEQMPDNQLVLALAENLHRAQLSPMDEARACAALLDLGYTREDVSLELTRSRNWVADRLALLELPADVQRMVDTGELPIGKAADLGKKVARNRGGSVTVGAKAVYNFTRAHPLAAVAMERCNKAGHHINGRFGGAACGVCWEDAIRADERARSAVA